MVGADQGGQDEIGLGLMMRLMAEEKLVTSRGKKSVPRTEPPPSFMNFVIQLAVMCPYCNRPR